MEQAQTKPVREWPKWLWGPDGQRARFDSPADVPRDYTADRQPLRLVPTTAPAVAPQQQSMAPDDLRAMVGEMVRAELKAIAVEKMAKARAAKAKA